MHPTIPNSFKISGSKTMRLKVYLPYLILLAAPVLILVMVFLSIRYGAKQMDWDTVQTALLHFDPDNVNHQIIIGSRLPRAAGTLLIGAALAVSGALMQGITGNYLASPSLMGVTDGSALAITLCLLVMPDATVLEQMAFSFLGSALGAGLVFGMGSLVPNGLSPVRLAILGTITGTFLSGVAAALALYYHVAQDISFWYNARLHQLNPEYLKPALLFMAAGFGIALWASRSITLLSLGEEVALSLGQRTALIKGVAALAVMLLTGVAVALAGKIGFVGLIIPHIVRYLVGVDYKRVIPCAAVLGGIFLAGSDLLSRFLNYPFETPVGVVTALIGVPFFLYLARKRGGNQDA
ncbi:iron complex transport system permease protein [Hydrogenispora ethanolica]|uniref:Iron complex transport system permease protein n=2 Tax=Hydrogenispora ethanolica TaxID=1082276 RepID=A0A4R1RVM0_HYDET|nr:iron complex transport system permease protein [Hydrogenispora ethanolica]